MLSKGSQTQKVTYCTISFIWNPSKGKPRVQKVDHQLSGVEEAEIGLPPNFSPLWGYAHGLHIDLGCGYPDGCSY